MFIRRNRRGPDPWITLKITLFFVGAALGFLGMVTERDWPILVGIGILLVGAGLRFLPRGEADDE